MATPLSRKKVFTTGDVAGICKVAPRTVSKWFDSGRLKGYRIPGSQDRRIPREELVKFLKASGMPLGELEEAEGAGTVLVFGDNRTAADLGGRLADSGPGVADVESGFALAVAMHEAVPRVVVIDTAVGRSQAVAIAATIRTVAAWAGVRLVAVYGEDEGPPDWSDAAFQQPVIPDALAAAVRKLAADA